MKTLFLIRHAKSSWDDATLKDFDRPLNKRGHQNATEMANRLKKDEITFDKILSSPAIRAKTTAIYFAEILEIPAIKVEFIASIYESYEDNIIQLVCNTSNSINSLAIFGHNPTFTMLANIFSETPIMNVPTCGIVAIQFNTEDWRNFFEASRKMLFFDYPKNIR